MPLDAETIAQLLNEHEKVIDRYGNYSPPKFEPPKQIGPVRFYYTEHHTNRCSNYTEPPSWLENSGGICGSPAYIQFQGKYMCTVHILKACNKMLIELGVLE